MSKVSPGSLVTDLGFPPWLLEWLLLHFFPEPERLFLLKPPILDFGLISPNVASNFDGESAFLSFLSVDNCSRGLSEDQIKTYNNCKWTSLYYSRIILKNVAKSGNFRGFFRFLVCYTPFHHLNHFGLCSYHLFRLYLWF